MTTASIPSRPADGRVDGDGHGGGAGADGRGSGVRLGDEVDPNATVGPSGAVGPRDAVGPSGAVGPDGGPAEQRGARTVRRIAIASVLLALTLLGHRLVPGELGFLLETALMFLGLGVAPLLVWALVRRSRRGALSVMLPALAWALLFGPAWVPLAWTAPAPSTASLTVGTQNISVDAATATTSAADLAAAGADVIGLQELTKESRLAVTADLASSHPYVEAANSVGLWSRFPIENARGLDLGLGWERAVAARVVTPAGPVSVYVVHAASARAGAHGERDRMLAALAEEVRADPSERVVVMGDLNTVSTDRALSGLTDQLAEPNLTSGGPALTWPVTLPLLGLDHVLGRGVEFTDRRSVRAGAGDHLATVASMNL